MQLVLQAPRLHQLGQPEQAFFVGISDAADWRHLRGRTDRFSAAMRARMLVFEIDCGRKEPGTQEPLSGQDAA